MMPLSRSIVFLDLCIVISFGSLRGHSILLFFLSCLLLLGVIFLVSVRLFFGWLIILFRLFGVIFPFIFILVDLCFVISVCFLWRQEVFWSSSIVEIVNTFLDSLSHVIHIILDFLLNIFSGFTKIFLTHVAAFLLCSGLLLLFLASFLSCILSSLLCIPV